TCSDDRLSRNNLGQSKGNSDVCLCQLSGLRQVVLHHCSGRPLLDLPELYGLVFGTSGCCKRAALTVCGQQEVAVGCAQTPGNPVDPLVDFQALQVVELWLVRLELCVELELARAPFVLAALEKNHPACSVARRQKVSGRVKLDCRDDVCVGNLCRVAL